MERVAFAIYLLVLIISPLLFGAVHAYAYSFVFAAILIAGLLLAVHNIRHDYRSKSTYFQYPVTRFNLLFILVLGFLFLQVIPLPSFIVGLLSPASQDVKSQAALLTDTSPFMSFAPYLYPVRMSIIRWTVYGLFFLGLTQVLNTRKRLEITCLVILATAVFVSLYGIYQTYAGDNRIWWFSGFGGDVRGTYINRNHFAGFMTMGLILAIGFACSLVENFYRKDDASGYSFKAKVLRSLSLEQSHSKRVLVIFGGVIIGLGLVLSASRGGIISAALGLLVLGIFYITRQSQKKNGLIVLVFFLLIAAYGVHVGLEHTVERFQEEQLQSSFEGRYRYAQKTMDVFRDYQITGVGLGNFQYAYPRYQAPEDMGMLIDYAHNDWAQLLAEAGILGFALVLFGIGYFLYYLVRRWRTRRYPPVLALGVVPLAALVAMGLHSFFDFNLHIPANFLVLAAVISIGQAALKLRMRKAGEKFELQYKRLYLQKRGGLVVLLILVLIVWTGGWTVRHFAAEIFCNTVLNSTLVREPNPSIAMVRKAIDWDRYNAGYWHELAEALARQKQDQEMVPMTAALEKAVRLNPYNALYYLELGWAYTRKWQEPDFDDKWLPAADHSMDMAGILSGARVPRLHRDVGTYWLMRSKTLDPSSNTWDLALQKVGKHYRMAIDLEKGKKQQKLYEEIERTLWSYYPDPELIEKLKITGAEVSRFQGFKGKR